MSVAVNIRRNVYPLEGIGVTVETIQADETPVSFLVSTRGDGTGVGRISIESSDDLTLTLDGTAKFYSDLAGTLDESDSWICTSGSLRSISIRCPSDTANLTFNKPSRLIKLGKPSSISGYAAGWSYTTEGGGSTNAPSLTINNLTNSYFPNVGEISFMVSPVALGIYNIGLSDLPNNLIKCQITCSSTITGTTSDIPPYCELLYLSDNTISGNTNQIPSSLIQAAIYGSNSISGNIGDIPSGMTYFLCWGGNTIGGNISYISSTIDYLYIMGNNTITGDVAGLASGVESFLISGGNTISGDIAYFPSSITTLYLSGSNTLEGSLNNIPPNCISISVYGNNTLTGGFAYLSSSISQLRIQGSNTINGILSDLPTSLSLFDITGSNTVSGSLSSLSSSLTYFTCGGSNTISGTVSSIPSNVYYFDVSGYNTISGDIGGIPDVTCRTFRLTGNNTVSDYSGRTWHSTTNEFRLIPTGAGGLSSTEVDNLLIDIDGDCDFTGGMIKAITLTGTNAVRTSASDSAVSSLQAKGVSLTLNS